MDNIVTVNAANVQFEFGQFMWPAFEERRVVHPCHVLSMSEMPSGTLAEGWHELGTGLSSPRPLGAVLMAPATVPFHSRGNGGRLRVARLLIRQPDNDLDTLSRERDPVLLKDCLNIRCANVTHGMRRLISEAMAPGFASNLAIEAISAMIIVDLVRYLQRSNGEIGTGRSLSQAELSNIYDYVDANLTKRISIKDLASLIGVSDRHFMRIFRARTGETVFQFVERQRFQKAKTLLDESDRPLKQIAHQLGFSSRVGFTLAFQRMAGQTPQEYRRASRPKLLYAAK